MIYRQYYTETPNACACKDCRDWFNTCWPREAHVSYRLQVAAHLGMWLARIFEMHRVCTKCQGIDCFCDVEVTGEA